MLTPNIGEKLSKITDAGKRGSYRPGCHTPTTSARSTIPFGSLGINAQQHGLLVVLHSMCVSALPKTLL